MLLTVYYLPLLNCTDQLTKFLEQRVMHITILQQRRIFFLNGIEKWQMLAMIPYSVGAQSVFFIFRADVIKLNIFALL